MTFNEKMDPEWVRQVKTARRSILSSYYRKPLKLLTDLFELYQGDFDVTNFEATQPELYGILEQFCSDVPKNTTELRERSEKLVRFFNDHKEEIRHFDIEIYYALLNFVDMLKCKNIYFDFI